jgi:hypothetical protein
MSPKTKFRDKIGRRTTSCGARHGGSRRKSPRHNSRPSASAHSLSHSSIGLQSFPQRPPVAHALVSLPRCNQRPSRLPIRAIRPIRGSLPPPPPVPLFVRFRAFRGSPSPSGGGAPDGHLCTKPEKKRPWGVTVLMAIYGRGGHLWAAGGAIAPATYRPACRPFQVRLLRSRPLE